MEAAALVHDIGIKAAEERYGSSAGRYQEELGPKLAEEMLKSLSEDDAVIDRVRFLVGHHHTYSEIDGLDYQILVEADFLVNIFEDGVSYEAAVSVGDNIFKTETGRRILSDMFALKI